jgi:hypothetical protein
MNKKIIVLLLTLQSFALCAQVPVNNFTPKEKLYLQILIQAADYLKSKPTKYFDFHPTETYSKDEAFYDTVISKFFNKEKMLKNFEQKTEVFALEGKVDIIRHILNGCDYNLDFVAADSIFVTPFRYKITDTLKTAEDSMLLDALEIFFTVDGKKMSTLICWFDKDTNKLLALSPSGTSDVAENKRLINFLHRQKNFYEYPVKRNLGK